jgi:hypothetical protein
VPPPEKGRGVECSFAKASGSPAVNMSGTLNTDALGSPSAKVAGFRSPTSATALAPSSGPGMGRSGTVDGSAGESATTTTEVDADTGNTSGGLGAMATSAAPPARRPPR